MRLLGWCFIGLNIGICVSCVWYNTRTHTSSGKRQRWNSSQNWMWVWQLLGVLLALSLRLSPWHLAWWFVLGFLVHPIVRKLRGMYGLARRMPRLYQNWPLALRSLVARHRQTFTLQLREGAQLCVHAPGYDTFIVNEIWADKQYTPSSSFSIRDGWVVVDIGAHKGIFAVFAATRARDVKVSSFEASPENFACLSRNVRLNHLSNVQAFNVAVGGRDGVSTLNLYRDNGQNTLLKRSNPALHPVGSVRVETWSLATVLNTVAARVNLLKMDIEGMEYETLFSCPDEYLERVDRIALEYHDVWVRVPHTVFELVEFLNAKGFSTHLTAGNEILLAERICDLPAVAQFSQTEELGFPHQRVAS
jgi:FkbM family methyltransferase